MNSGKRLAAQMVEANAYDPEALGARCDLCVLKTRRDGGPVGPELRYDSNIAMVAEAPGEKEVEHGRPLVGPSGMELNEGMKSIGASRQMFNIHNAICCRAPENDLDKVMLKWQRENKKREKEGLEPVPSPIECCRPRLINELGDTFGVIALGKTAFTALTRKSKSILEIRGGPVVGYLNPVGDFVDGPMPADAPNGSSAINILPTLHPAFVLRARRWTRAFRSDLSRAHRWFTTGTVGWVEPHITVNPTPEELKQFLSRTDVDYAVDVETSIDDPTVADLRTVGIGHENAAMVVVLKSIETGQSAYPASEDIRIRGILKDFFTDLDKVKVGHNCLYSGTPVILGDGTSRPIDQLVRERYTGDVMALDRDGNMVTARVTDWFRKRESEQKWLVIRRAGEKAHARGLTLTPDHEVFTTRGRVRADALVVGDEILTGERQLRPDEQAAILGSLLGDSTAVHYSNNMLTNPAEAPTAVFRGSHTPGALAEEKARWLGGLLRLGTAKSNGYKPGQTVTTYRTPQMRQIAELSRLVYADAGKRRLRPETLDRLGPVGLAWLFADDGFKHTRPDRKRETVLIAACGFPAEDIEAGRAWFDTHFGTTTVTKEGSLRLGIAASQKFAAYVAPYLLPAARYKLPVGDWPEFCGFPQPSQIPHAVRIEHIEEFSPPVNTAGRRMAAETRWCLQTTEGNFLTGFGFVKNCGYFDQMVIRNHFGADIKPLMDTILLHRSVESELPHKLAYVGSIYTDVTSWKEAHTATEAKSDKELAIYNGIDCVVTARAATKLAEAAFLRGQQEIVRKDHRIQQVCVGLHENGMLVDRHARDVAARELIIKIQKYRADAQLASGRQQLNPNSVPQLRDLLFAEWKLQPVDYTKLGDPSTNDECVRAMRAANKGNDKVIRFLDALRRYRKVAKEYGTYVRRLIPYGQPLDGLAWKSEEEEEESERGLIMKDGRIRPDYNAHGTTSGRLSSSNPNCFTGDTEILTERGWIRFDELPRGVSVAQYHADKRVTWAMPTAYIEKDFDGELVHVKNQHIDLLVTPEHRCLVRHRKTGELRVFEAKDYPEDWQQINAGHLLSAGGASSMSIGLLMLIVAAQADGSWVKGTRNRRLTFKFSKARKVARLHKIIEMLGSDIVVRVDRKALNGKSGQRRIEIEGAAVDQVFTAIGERKEFGRWLLDLPAYLSGLFCDEVFYWDGCATRMNHYSSNSRVNASWVQTMLALNGMRTNLRPYQGTRNVNWQTDVTRRDYSLTTNIEKTRVPYVGKVYCVSVPSSYILVRRNGKVMVTGQSQNFPKHLRKLIVPAPGNVIVGADADQLELRIITAIARIQVYLEAFNNKQDPHAMTAALMFGKKFTDLQPKSDLWDKLRKIAKSIKYASFYGSGDETVHGLVTSAEDDNGNLMYPDLTLREVSTLKRNWLKGIPELPKWWDETLEEYRSSGYVIDPVWGRRRDFLDGEAFNEIVNHPIQSAGAHIIHESTFDLLQEIPFEKWGPGTGLISQVHDALYVECPEKEAEWVAKTIEKHMNRVVKGLDGVAFSAKAKIGKDWGSV